MRNQKRLFIGQTDSQATGKVYWRKWVDHLYLSWWLHQIKKENKSKQLSVRKCIVWVNRLRSLKSARINSLPVTQHEGKNVSFNSSFIGKSSVLCTIWQKLNKASNCINLPRLNAVWSFLSAWLTDYNTSCWQKRCRPEESGGRLKNRSKEGMVRLLVYLQCSHR